MKTRQLSKGFSFISHFYFSPNLKYAAFSRVSEFHAKAKEDYEDDLTEDLWLMDLSNFNEKIIRKADDHTDFSGIKWISDNEFCYKKVDYIADTKKDYTMRIP
ncbi:hypothetical protein NV379_23010 [Paenibacillus sp. N1-5-1-14]|uniref:hypothetical protein n=1 Tax=Paenibacillus radicibacter TaxID=2972488 RepID=UPI0021591C56|nr:hypothetical protein [Paenibacillus radicibacter]MCR8645511.1 hypothetical protein [Paenibacillus radicibacter]